MHKASADAYQPTARYCDGTVRLCYVRLLLCYLLCYSLFRELLLFIGIVTIAIANWFLFLVIVMLVIVWTGGRTDG